MNKKVRGEGRGEETKERERTIVRYCTWVLEENIGKEGGVSQFKRVSFVLYHRVVKSNNSRKQELTTHRVEGREGAERK